jgi:hypothetical protein
MSDLEIGVEVAIMALLAYWVLMILASSTKNETFSTLLFVLIILVMAVMVILSADLIVGIVLFLGIFVIPKFIGRVFNSE